MGLIHANAIVWQGRGVLLRGASGRGKSDLSLRIIASGGRLVADDQVELTNQHGQLIASCPDNLKSLIEIRGLGIIKLPEQDICQRIAIAAIFDLVLEAEIERYPLPVVENIMNVILPCYKLWGFAASAPLKIKYCLENIMLANNVK